MLTQEQAAQAVKEGQIAQVKIAIDCGLENFTANDVLKYSLGEGNYDMAQMAVDRGADVNLEFEHLPIWAVGLQEEQALDFLIQNGANVEAQDGMPMFVANAIEDNPKMKQMLLAAGADPKRLPDFDAFIEAIRQEYERQKAKQGK